MDNLDVQGVQRWRRPSGSSCKFLNHFYRLLLCVPAWYWVFRAQDNTAQTSNGAMKQHQSKI